jgi:hypothetical protein
MRLIEWLQATKSVATLRKIVTAKDNTIASLERALQIKDRLLDLKDERIEMLESVLDGRKP